MSERTPTLLIVYLHPDHDEGARYHLDETLTMAAIAYRLIAQHEERVSLEGSAPFVVTHMEKRLVFALRAPLDPKTIDALAQLVATGLLLGFVVKDEIALGAEVGCFIIWGDRAGIRGAMTKAAPTCWLCVSRHRWR